MKYMLLVQSDPSAWAEWEEPTEDFQATLDFMAELNAELLASGELVDGAGLADPALARTVHRRGSAVVTTDGPFAESKEVLGGYWVLDCDSYDRALEVAAQVVAFHHGPETIEVRPIMDPDRGLEM